MNYLDRDIKKLKKYANSLGLKIYTRPNTKFTGEAQYDGKCITLFPTSKTSKNEIIMTLLHELGHHLDWLENRLSKNEEAAIISLNSGKMEGKRDDLTKEHRRLILKIEKHGIKRMSRIHRLLKLEVEYYKVKHQEEVDLFQYQFLYRYGKFATLKESKKTYNNVKFYKAKYGR